MSPLTKMLLDLEYKGKKEGIISIAKKMIERKIATTEISEITGLSKEELEKLAKNQV